MTAGSGRVTCPRCGTNNFDTVTMCWKCGTSLQAGGSPPIGNVASPLSPPSAAPMGYVSPASAVERPGQSSVAYANAGSDGDPGVAQRAAILLALVIPFVGLPVGWIFMMIEDRRKQAIGRVCVTWSIIALLLHILLMFVLSMAAVPALSYALQKLQPGQGSSSQGGRTPDLRGLSGE